MIDYDRLGHCVKCHCLIAETEGEGRNIKIIQKFSNASQIDFNISNGTIMPVAICTDCKSKLQHTEEERVQIMNSVVKGWDKEIDWLGWGEDKRKEYMKKFSNLKILSLA